MQPLKSERFSAYSHALTVPIMLVGTIILTNMSWENNTVLIASLTYGISAMILFSTSFLYHSKKKVENESSIWRKLDHSAIFILIAGTYTPICYFYLEGSMKWGILIAQWSLVLTGIFSTIYFIKAPRFITTMIYLIMGWIVIIPIKSLINTMPPQVFFFLLAGGIAYTVGAIIYILKKPNPIPGIIGFHEIFHILIIAGALFHLMMVMQSVKIIIG